MGRGRNEFMENNEVEIVGITGSGTFGVAAVLELALSVVVVVVS